MRLAYLTTVPRGMERTAPSPVSDTSVVSTKVSCCLRKSSNGELVNACFMCQRHADASSST